MKETKNTIAQIIFVIGCIGIVAGVFSFFLSFAYDGSYEVFDNIAHKVAGLSGVISGIVFLGFSEIIKLLQKSTDQNQAILKELSAGEKNLLQNIEENLPEM